LIWEQKPLTQPVRRICALVAYDGTDYNGFQIQAGVETIQGTLETALEQCVGHTCRVIGSGRTDTGVHARGQVIASDVVWRHSTEALMKAWNHFLPSSILIRAVADAPEGFHPRYSATSRTYRYLLYHPKAGERGSWVRFPLLDRHALIIGERLDVEAMNVAAALLRGEHDFATFGQPPQGEITVRHIEEIRWQVVGGDRPEIADLPLEPLLFTVKANAFLRRMVRNLVGTLLVVGRGDWQIDDVVQALVARDRSRSAPPAPPNGLVLERVEYSTFPLLFSDRQSVA
jgi:tRNA pseudouridine38-40 synthase